MSDFSCPDCFKDQRSFNDKYQQIKIDAKKFADKEKTKVSIIQDGPEFYYIAFSGAPPAGTREVIIPV